MRICLCKSPWFRTAIFVSMAFPLSVGCGSVKKNRGSDFLKPLASSSSSEANPKHEPMPSERSLCMETAKTVAAQGHAMEAIKLYERAEQLDPAAAALDAKLAPLYAEVGKQDAAFERYKRCVQLSPDDTKLSNNFAWTLMEAGRFDQAVDEANRGLQSDPNNVRLRSTLAMIHYRQGDRAGSLQHFQQAHGKTAAHHNLAILDIDAGNLEAAKKHLQIAKQSTQSNSETELLLSALESQISKR